MSRARRIATSAARPGKLIAAIAQPSQRRGKNATRAPCPSPPLPTGFQVRRKGKVLLNSVKLKYPVFPGHRRCPARDVEQPSRVPDHCRGT